MTESAVMQLVFGFSDGMFSIDIEKRAKSASTSMRYTLRVSAGSAQIFQRDAPDAGQRMGYGHVQIGEIALGGLARPALKNPERLPDAFDRNPPRLELPAIPILPHPNETSFSRLA